MVEGLNPTFNLCHTDSTRGEVRWLVPEIRYQDLVSKPVGKSYPKCYCHGDFAITCYSLGWGECNLEKEISNVVSLVQNLVNI